MVRYLKKIKAPYKGIPEGCFKKGDVAWSLNLIDKKAKFYSTVSDSDTIALFKNECKSYDELLDKLVYAPTCRNIVNYYKLAGVSYEEWLVK